MIPTEKYEAIKHKIAFEETPEKRIKAIKLIIAEYSDVLSDSQINGLKLNIKLIQRQKAKQEEQKRTEKQKFEKKVNRYIDNVKRIVSPEKYEQFLNDMYTTYHTYGTTLAEFHIAMRCFNEQAEIMEEEK